MGNYPLHASPLLVVIKLVFKIEIPALGKECDHLSKKGVAAKRIRKGRWENWAGLGKFAAAYLFQMCHSTSNFMHQEIIIRHPLQSVK